MTRNEAITSVRDALEQLASVKQTLEAILVELGPPDGNVWALVATRVPASHRAVFLGITDDMRGAEALIDWIGAGKPRDRAPAKWKLQLAREVAGQLEGEPRRLIAEACGFGLAVGS